MKRAFVCGAALALGVLIAAPNAAAWSRKYKREWQIKMCKDPVVKRWTNCEVYDNRGLRGAHFKGAKQPFPASLLRSCGRGIFKCQAGWKLFMGRGDRRIKALFRDTLILAKWGDNDAEIPKLSITNFRLVRLGVIGAVMAAVKNAGPLLHKHINTRHKQDRLWCSERSKIYDALWWSGYKPAANDMIKGLAIHRCNANHSGRTLDRLDAWKLSKAQIRAIEKTCVDDIFPSTNYSLKSHGLPGCLRYLSRVGTRNSDFFTFAKQYLGTGGRPEAFEALRALGRLGHKSVRGKLKSELKGTFAKRQRSYLVGRRIRRKKVNTWGTNARTVAVGMALASLGDRYAWKAIKYWTGFLKDGSFHNTSSWKAVFSEAPFCNPKIHRRLRSHLSKAFKKALRHMRKKRSHRYQVQWAAIGLMQMGDKKAFKYVIKQLKEGDRSTIHSYLQAMGGMNGSRFGDTHGWGLGHIHIGKTGLSVRQAQTLAKTIRKQFKFWNDLSRKEAAIRAVHDIEARIKGAKQR